MMVLRILWGVLRRVLGRRPVPVLDYYRARGSCPFCVVGPPRPARFVRVLSMRGSVPIVMLLCSKHAWRDADAHRRSGHVIRSTPPEFN